MRTSSDISLGDLMISLSALKPGNDHTVSAIARLLGLEVVPRAPAPGDGPAAGDSRWIEEDSQENTDLAAEPPRRAGPENTPSTRKSDEIERMLTPAMTATEQLDGPWAPVDELERPGTRHLEWRRPYEPLFDPRANRELLFVTAARSTPSGPIDAERMVRIVAAGRPLAALPRHPRLTVAAGLQLLIDVGPGMGPFRRDQSEAVAVVEDVVGRDHVERIEFTGCPARGVVTDDGPRPYQAPPPGCPLLVLTTLGRTGGHVEWQCDLEWLRLAERLAAQSSRVVALVPFRRPPTARIRRLATRMVIVPWDRRTTVAAVRRAIEETGP